ncbi:phosphoribosylformylglycinamidine synthase isoform X3 [Hippocampus comes]|uniref:phosphoribosylformylglycinamidine synthase isoform X3 n=1 Tax=Hippocampus comes TaxID=109280 RepID=UPI00094EC614|nr:PREDICTED: phosphoribosylformylglycinamidine synthase isoform X3 [Hippocampus comes]
MSQVSASPPTPTPPLRKHCACALQHLRHRVSQGSPSACHSLSSIQSASTTPLTTIVRRHVTPLSPRATDYTSPFFGDGKKNSARTRRSKSMAVVRFYGGEVRGRSLQRAAKLYPRLSIATELCYNVELMGSDSLSAEHKEILVWLFQPPLQAETLSETPKLKEGDGATLVEIGPRLNFSTAWSTNAVSICQSAGLASVTRVELSRRFLIKLKDEGDMADVRKDVTNLIIFLHDSMTECIYERPVASFAVDAQAQPVFEVDILGEGRAALEKANDQLGLAFDDWDLDLYTAMFQRIQRNPTSVECFDLAQSNSEHSRHWFFRGRVLIDGEEQKETLFRLIMNTQEHSNGNNVIKFCDNSSGIQGMELECLYPKDTSQASPYETRRSLRHVIFTAETHNFPTGVAPFSGATTGTGGRIRDVQSAGRGGHVIAGTAGYCFGNLHIPGYALPWEQDCEGWEYPTSFAQPLQVAIEASDGASDYGNKFGEPVLSGFARSFGMRLPNGERREWIKPIMFSGGLGCIEDAHVKKEQPEKGMEVVKIGGPVYRIGVGGGAASSVQVQGDNSSDRDLGAVQRGDAEMEQKMNRALRACLERRGGNPICSIHDQGAGGNGNVLKELSEPAGAIIYCSRFKKGDPTLSVLELWGAEYQESNALLLHPSDRAFLERVCQREKCPVDFVGNITGDGKIVLVDDEGTSGEQVGSGRHPVDLQLEWVLGKMPQKEFRMERLSPVLRPLLLPAGLTVRDTLERVLRLPAVASKRYLTNKVDRSVTGLVAQQQCVGPLHTPLADVAVVALSPLGLEGAATAIGEQPVKALVNAAAGARMAVGEALTNLMFARVTALKDVKCSGNWMWAAKLPGEGALLWESCRAMCKVMGELGVAIDGGKDSLSMAARVGKETVKAPGALVISAYAVCPDISATITPDLEDPHGKGVLLWVPLSPGQHRLGGSALAQCYAQLGDCSPDMEQPQLLAACFNATQMLISDRLLSAGHDISDGGLISCVLEMAFAGNRGVDLDVPSLGAPGVIELLFAEELGLLLEVSEVDEESVRRRFLDAGVECHRIGRTSGFGPEAMVTVRVDGQEVLRERLPVLRALWEETSFQLERLQADELCVQQEEEGLARRTQPTFKVTFDPSEIPLCKQPAAVKPRVAVLREEGSNGDREMSTSLHMAGFEVWDVTMQDLCSAAVTLEPFRAVVFVGGFSYADVLGSAKGWAATVAYNAAAKAQFDRFRRRADTLSLGVCNGCQLLALLGWVGESQDGAASDVVLTHNKSGRFESRFVTVGIQASPSVWLAGMEGSALGVWVAHGEGLMQFRNAQVLDDITSAGLAPVRYLDDDSRPTEEYPLNPNGSPRGVAGLCSRDGRHLAMMPHPERCTLGWQWPWAPRSFRPQLEMSPWLRMFRNAAAWCSQ